MVKRGPNTFSATKVAKAGLAASAVLTRILELGKEVSKLRHHVSVLSRRNHVLQKEAENRRDDNGAEVASPVRVQEPEPQVVVEPEVRMSRVIVAEGEEDVWVAPVAKPPVAESRVAVEMDEPEVALVKLPKSKKRRLNVVGDVEEEDEAEVMTVVPIPVEEGGGTVVAPLGPRLELERGGLVIPRGPRLADGPRVRGWNVVRREYRFVDRSLIGERNGMVGDSNRTRGNFARAPVRGNFGGRFAGRSCAVSLIVDRGQEELRIRSGRRPWALTSHMNRLGACVYLTLGDSGWE